MIYYILDGVGEPIAVSAQAYSAYYQRDDPFALIGSEPVGHGRLSTVFLSINYNFSGRGPPLLFETMVFMPGESGELLDRYATRTEALAGHLRHHTALTAYDPPPPPTPA
jgi:hypothetical protein